MTVMGMLSAVGGMIKVRTRDKADIDSPFFKLHYRTTATILFICCILVTANDLIGKTIDCMGGNIPGNVLNTYCWIMATFSVPGECTDYIYRPPVFGRISGWVSQVMEFSGTLYDCFLCFFFSPR